MQKFLSVLLVFLLSVVLIGCGSDDTQKTSIVSGVETANIDRSVKPQDDFYDYVNGSWLKKTKIPSDKSQYSAFTEVDEKTKKDLEEIVLKIKNKTAAQRDADEKQIWDLYSSYIDTTTIEGLGITPLEPTINKILSMQSYEDVLTVMADLFIKKATIPLYFYVSADAKNSKENILYLDQDGLGLPDRDYYLKNDETFTNIQTKYKQYISDLLSLSNFVGDTRQVAQNIYDLEVKIATIQWTNEENRDAIKTYNKMSVTELNSSMGSFDMKFFLEKMNLSNVDKLVVTQPSYCSAFGKLFAQTSISTWKEYLLFHVINDYAHFLSSNFVTLHFAFYSTTLNGIEEQKSRDKSALDLINSVLGEVFGKIYVANYFPAEAKESMEILVDNLLKSYDTSIDTLTWMSATTKKAAKEKLHKITAKIAYPDQWNDYSDLKIQADDLVGNFMRYAQYSYNKDIAEIGKEVDRTKWYMNPQTVNAYYDPTTNEVVFPAAILQPPFFNMKADMAINYGAIGSVIGHEISHAFDDYGSKYDGDGNLNDWWTPEDAEKFKALGEKLVTQYNQYEPLLGHYINGKLTLGENMADLNGVTMGYKAYQLFLKTHKVTTLDGFSANQRFFIGWAQIWRRKMKEEEALKRLIIDPHSPAKYRVIGVLSNITPFYEAFDVNESNLMYKPLEDRIQIW